MRFEHLGTFAEPEVPHMWRCGANAWGAKSVPELPVTCEQLRLVPMHCVPYFDKDSSGTNCFLLRVQAIEAI